MFQRLFLRFPLRQQVNRRLACEVFQCQLRTRCIHSVQPVQKWLARREGQQWSFMPAAEVERITIDLDKACSRVSKLVLGLKLPPLV